jgi:hypothetical protein
LVKYDPLLYWGRWRMSHRWWGWRYPGGLPHLCLLLYSSPTYEGVSKSFRIESITKSTLTTINTRWEATQRVMAAKLTRLTERIAIQLHLVAERCTICSSQFSFQAASPETFGYTLVWQPVRFLSRYRRLSLSAFVWRQWLDTWKGTGSKLEGIRLTAPERWKRGESMGLLPATSLFGRSVGSLVAWLTTA